MSRSGRQAFPDTQKTLLGRLLVEPGEGPREAAMHLMRVYERPLRVYLLGSDFRDIGPADELINGFFADRLSREQFLEDWLLSGQRLRYWLIRAFRYYLLEQIRARRRAASAPWRLLERRRVPGNPRGPQQDFHRTAGQEIVRQAFDDAQRACGEDGMSAHWEAFCRHHLHHESYASIAAELSVTPARAAVMARTAQNRFRAALREAVAWPGATDGEIDDEIEAMIEIIQS